MSVTPFDSVTLTVEIALEAAASTYAVWDVGAWDSALWGPDISWVDVSAYVRSVSTSRGFSRDLQAWEAGTASVVLDNRDGRFSPANLAGPYVTAGVTQVRPWRPIRITATYAGTTFPIYRGYVQAWVEGYVIGPTNSVDAISTVSCVDELAALARFDGAEQGSVGAGETTGRRIHRILDSAGHTGDRAIDDGVHTVQATTLAQDAVTEMKLVADSEGGALWIDADGTVMFVDQLALIEDPRSNTVQATYGDGGGSEIAYSDIELAYDGSLLANIATLSRSGGTAQTSADAASRALYGDARYARSDLVCETDAQVDTLADIWVARYSQPEQRVTRITLSPRRDPATMYPDLLGRKIRDLVRVKRRPPGSYTITRDVYVAGISHQITAEPKAWTTTLDLWSATPWTEFSTSLWDTGLWDSALWMFG
jgi:hypothetical protein